MRIDYSEQGSEPTQGPQYSSAGEQTRPLRWPTMPGTSSTIAPRRSGGFALILIAVGGLLLLSQGLSSSGVWNLLPESRYLPDKGQIQGGLVLMTIAACFLFFGITRRFYLALIPGCIVAGLSVGVIFSEMSGGASVMWGLAAGFAGIRVLGERLFNLRGNWANWPLIPAVPLFLVGVLAAISHLSDLSFSGWLLGVPLLLVGLGMYLWENRRIPSAE